MREGSSDKEPTHPHPPVFEVGEYASVGYATPLITEKQLGLRPILWHFSTRSDKIFQVVAVAAAIGAGTTRPLMTIVFGSLVNDFNNIGAISSSQLKSLLTYIFSSTLSIVAARISRNLRLAYLRAIVCHDQSYRDTAARRSAANDISNEAAQVRNGLSETLGIAVQACSTVTTAFIIAFTQSWRLTLVMSTAVVTLFSGLFLVSRIETRTEGRDYLIYSDAAALLEEVFSSIQTVMAMGAEPKLLGRYSSYLDKVRISKLKKSPVSGIKFVLSFFILLSAYALAFWYGVKLLLDDKVRNSGNVVMYVSLK
ncbi:hypothetical protein NHQ30_008143 [Ciborinia camelliae]|nr:hypothetical protein NHQ30_008143 [Ciborinia camelliae]